MATLDRYRPAQPAALTPNYHLLMQCNIDKRGQVVRLWLGLLCIVAGIALGAAAFAAGWTAWIYLPAALLLVGGGFAVFEARQKWCAVRAMGIRTSV